MIVWSGGQFEKALEARVNRAIERAAIEYKQAVKVAVSKPGRRDFGQDTRGPAGFTPKLSREHKAKLIARSQGKSGNQTRNAMKRFKIRYSRHVGKSGRRNALGIYVHSLPGEPPRRQTGDYWRRISHEVNRSRRVARVGTNLKTAKWLEFGTRKMKARPHFRPTLDRMRGRIEGIIRGAAL